MTKRKITALSFVSILALVLSIPSCKKYDLLPNTNTDELFSDLSDYHIFQGIPSDLNPAAGYELYELSTALFSDYAEKQRLIKVPEGLKMEALSDGLPAFPDGTILVKTFFYYRDARDKTKGKRILETRLLIKSGSGWNAGTYLWNKDQTDARLINDGLDRTVNWIDASGNPKVIAYHVPNINECGTCHNSNEGIIPIGPKLRNLNFIVNRHGLQVNQLQYLQDSSLLSQVDISKTGALPDWRNTTNSLEERARAYLDINCAHCHKKDGLASDTKLIFDYEMPIDETNILDRKNSILDKFSEGSMPKLGTTVVDKEALELLKTFLGSKK